MAVTTSTLHKVRGLEGLVGAEVDRHEYVVRLRDNYQALARIKWYAVFGERVVHKPVFLSEKAFEFLGSAEGGIEARNWIRDSHEKIEGIDMFVGGIVDRGHIIESFEDLREQVNRLDKMFDAFARRLEAKSVKRY